ncbi:uncharacterized protein V6R79_015242 [Siganus canaliculatus]
MMTYSISLKTEDQGAVALLRTLCRGLLCILKSTINSCQCRGGDASAVRENHGRTEEKLTLEEPASPETRSPDPLREEEICPEPRSSAPEQDQNLDRCQGTSLEENQTARTCEPVM